MSIGIKVNQTRDFIRKDARGAIDLERSLEEVRQLAAASHYFQDHNMVLDLRDTVVDGTRADGLRVAAAFAHYFKSFHNKIAMLIPDTAERIEKANLMQRCMEAEGFEMKVFLKFEHAIEWFSEVVPLGRNNRSPR